MHEAVVVTFDNILDDIEGILATLQQASALSYAALQQQLGWVPRLPLIHYIRFFETQRWVNYDRVSDMVRLMPEGQGALASTERWEGSARAAFAAEMSEDDAPSQGGLDESTDPEDEDEELPTALIDGAALDLLDLTGDVVLEDAGSREEPGTYDEIAVPAELRMTEEQPLVLEPGEEEDDFSERTHVVQWDALSVSSDHELGASNWSASPRHTSPGPPFSAPPLPTETSPDRAEQGAPRSPHEDTMTTDSYRAGSSYVSSKESSAKGLYERQSEIGSGGVGTVYKAVHTRLGRPIAVKEIRNIFHVFADVQRDDIVRRFVEIVQTQATLDHPNIIQVYDVVSDTDYPYVVMQWAPKGSLRRLIDVEGRPPLNVAMSYFMQILHALHAAHEQGIVHGGLKPENVVLDPAGNAMLTDFGMTQVVERASGGGGNQVYVGVGTVAYLSPEQFRDSNLASVQSDIYSLGIMFYEMLTGKVPGRRSPMPSSFYPDIPRKLDDIFDRMCMDDIEDRFGTVKEILIEVYSSPEVLAIMDKRSGVLFLRDPIVHGELGMDELADLPDAPASEFAVSSGSSSQYDSYTIEGSSSSYGVSSGVSEEPAYTESASEDVADAPAAAAAASPSSSDGSMDKLDQYSALFDDDDD